MPGPAAKSGLLCLQELCDFAGPDGVLHMNDEPTVQDAPSGLARDSEFTNFMRKYQDMVFTTSARLVRNDAQAEDISQEVFIKAYEHFEMLSASPTAGGWLKTVATNLSLNHLQRYRNRWRFFSEMRSTDSSGEETPEVEFAAPDTFFEGIDSEERREWVEAALAKLPDHQHRQAQSMPFRPGITGAATLVFRCEEEMLRQIPEEQIEAFCKYKLTPYKTNLDFAYAERATFRSDVALMMRTAQVCMVRSKAKPPQPSAIL